MTLTFDRVTFQLSKSEEQLGSLADVVLSLLSSNPVGSYRVEFVSEFALELLVDLDLK